MRWVALFLFWGLMALLLFPPASFTEPAQRPATIDARARAAEERLERVEQKIDRILADRGTATAAELPPPIIGERITNGADQPVVVKPTEHGVQPIDQYREILKRLDRIERDAKAVRAWGAAPTAAHEFKPLKEVIADLDMPTPPPVAKVSTVGAVYQWQVNDIGEFLYKRLKGPTGKPPQIQIKPARVPGTSLVMPPALTDREMEILAQHREALGRLTAKREVLPPPKPLTAPTLEEIRKPAGKPRVAISRTDASGKKWCECDDAGSCLCGEHCDCGERSPNVKENKGLPCCPPPEAAKPSCCPPTPGTKAAAVDPPAWVIREMDSRVRDFRARQVHYVVDRSNYAVVWEIELNNPADIGHVRYPNVPFRAIARRVASQAVCPTCASVGAKP